MFPLGCTSSHQRNLCSPCPGTQLLGPRGSSCFDVSGDSRGLPCVRISASTLGALGPNGGGNRQGRETVLCHLPEQGQQAPAADMWPPELGITAVCPPWTLGVQHETQPRWEALACCHPLWPRFPLHKGRQASSSQPAHLPLSDPLPKGCPDPPQCWCPHWSFLRPPRAPGTFLPFLELPLPPRRRGARAKHKALIAVRAHRRH